MTNKRRFGFKILIEDRETYMKVAKRMNEEGIRWWPVEILPSNLERCNYFSERFPIYLLVDKHNRLSWSDLDSKLEGISEITPEEYLGENEIMTKADLKDCYFQVRI